MELVPKGSKGSLAEFLKEKKNCKMKLWVLFKQF